MAGRPASASRVDTGRSTVAGVYVPTEARMVTVTSCLHSFDGNAVSAACGRRRILKLLILLILRRNLSKFNRIAHLLKLRLILTRPGDSFRQEREQQLRK